MGPFMGNLIFYCSIIKHNYMIKFTQKSFFLFVELLISADHFPASTTALP